VTGVSKGGRKKEGTPRAAAGIGKKGKKGTWSDSILAFFIPLLFLVEQKRKGRKAGQPRHGGEKEKKKGGGEKRDAVSPPKYCEKKRGGTAARRRPSFFTSSHLDGGGEKEGGELRAPSMEEKGGRNPESLPLYFFSALSAGGKRNRGDLGSARGREGEAPRPAV